MWMLSYSLFYCRFLTLVGWVFLGGVVHACECINKRLYELEWMCTIRRHVCILIHLLLFNTSGAMMCTCRAPSQSGVRDSGWRPMCEYKILQIFVLFFAFVKYLKVRLFCIKDYQQVLQEKKFHSEAAGYSPWSASALLPHLSGNCKSWHGAPVSFG